MNQVVKNFLKDEKERKRLYDFHKQEKELKNNYPILVGVDDAGRGPLAGPVYAACVCLPTGIFINGLNDSKKISEKKRNIIATEIKEQAFFYTYGYSSVKEIDNFNILNATMLAMSRAIAKCPIIPDCCLVDGNVLPDTINCNGKAVIKGDLLMPSIAAASILAKTKRDEIMTYIHKIVPEYSFDRHKGYGTKAHHEALKSYGQSIFHRETFLKRFKKK